MSKNNQTPAEWFQELAALAKAHPERFEKMVLVYEAAVYEETLQSLHISPHQRSFGLKTSSEIVSFLEMLDKKIDSAMFYLDDNL